MKEKTTAEKMAEKAFFSNSIQKSWQGHMETFGPILEPAFTEDFQSRVHLTAALNLLSNRKVKAGVEKLAQLQDQCLTNADHAAWHFFMGVAAELSNNTADAMDHYARAGEYNHRFYLPYFKLARYNHFTADFEKAAPLYWKAAACLESFPLTQKNALALSSVYSNLSSCLTMMHCYADAMTALERSKAAADRNPSRLSTEAILYAAMKDSAKVDAMLSLIQKQAPGLLEATREMTEQILEGKHAHFTALPMDNKKIDVFWKWFSQSQITEEVLSKELAKIFSFMQRPLQIRIEGNTIFLRDFYVKTLICGYEVLLANCPDRVKATYQFRILH